MLFNLLITLLNFFNILFMVLPKATSFSGTKVFDIFSASSVIRFESIVLKVDTALFGCTNIIPVGT